MYLSFKEICDNYGFKFEQHVTATEDGYILTLFRIPGMQRESQRHSSKVIKSPLYFQHGIADSADAFVMNTAEKSPALIAAQLGYDVWLGNCRGNKYSREHEKLDPDESAKEFFDFTFVDMARQDIVSMVNYIKAITGAPKVGYVGHSMGTTMMLYLGSTNPAWVENSISAFVALAPVTVPLHTTSAVIKTLAPQLNSMKHIFDYLGVYELFNNQQSKPAVELVCGHIPGICEQGVKLIATSNLKADDAIRF